MARARSEARERTGAARRIGGARLTGRGRAFLLLAVALGLVGFGIGNAIFLITAFLLGALVLVSRILMHRRVLDLEATRSFSPSLVTAGLTTEATVVITNRSRSASASALWSDALPWGTGATAQQRLPALVAHRERYSNPGNRASFRYELRPPRRGIFAIGPLRVVTGDPFGLAIGAVSLAATDSLVVAPVVTDLSGRGMPLESGSGDSRVIERASSGGDDDLMTREYRRGDALRRVHWRASARHGELMVRQEEQRTRPEVRLLFDSRADGYRDVATAAADPRSTATESDSFEWIVQMVASIGIHLESSGFAVSTMESTGARFTRSIDGRGEIVQLRLLESLAAVRLTHREGPTPGGDRSEGDASSAPVFAVLCSPSPEVRDWVLSQRRPYERGTVILLATGLPMMRELLDPDAPSTRAIFEQAGWQCIEAEPTDDPTAVWHSVAMGAHVRS